MIESWVDFTVVVSAQLSLLLINAWSLGRVGCIPKYLTRGLAIGVVVGTTFDLLVGYYFGQYTYYLGFTALFLFFNGALSWGVFLAHLFLFDRLDAPKLYLHLVLLAVSYEVCNFFFAVWNWTFAIGDLATYLFVIGIGYPGMSTIFMVILTLFFKHKFTIFKF